MAASLSRYINGGKTTYTKDILSSKENLLNEIREGGNFRSKITFCLLHPSVLVSLVTRISFYSHDTKRDNNTLFFSIPTRENVYLPWVKYFMKRKVPVIFMFDGFRQTACSQFIIPRVWGYKIQIWGAISNYDGNNKISISDNYSPINKIREK